MKQTKINRIRENLINNKDGITLNFMGNIENKQDGFYISISNIKGKSINYLIKKTLSIRNTAFKEVNNLFMGGWNDGTYYFLDLTLYIKDKDKAIYLGKLFKQQAIFDIKKCDCVYLK